MGRTTAAEPKTNSVEPAASLVQHVIARNRKRAQGRGLARPRPPSTSRLEASHKERAFCVEEFVAEAQSKPKEETVLYLAYGSNLQAAKFRGDRGINPLAQVNVQVPSLKMTFDLPGIPYLEPCFANTARRDGNNDFVPAHDATDEKTALLGRVQEEKFRKEGWHKGLIGVVYEVTAKDYAHIIATEGGGAGYQDILVDCHPFESSDPNVPVPDTPSLPPFKAHTLFAPRVPDGDDPPKRGGHIQRPDPDYAQPSARYLNIMTEGAAECELPFEYQDYLQSLSPYTITTIKQRVGQFVLLALWMPIVMSVFGLGKIFVDKNGKLPDWMVRLTNATFGAVWASYDAFFKRTFGDGERTIEDSEERDGLKLPLHKGDVEKDRQM